MENSLMMNHSSNATTGTLVSQDSLAMAEELAIGPKPKRPLSAYNFFFAWERQQILESRQVREEGKPKRSHGKCGFAQMARSVAQKWNNDEIDPEIKRMFEEKAQIEKMRYNQEMDAWKKRRAEYRRNHGSPKNNNKKKKKAAKTRESPNKFTGVSSSSPVAGAATVSNNSSAASFLSQQEQQSSTEFMHNQMQGNAMMMLNIMSPMNQNNTNTMTSSNNHNGGVMTMSGPAPGGSAPLQNAALLQAFSNVHMNNNTPSFIHSTHEQTPPPPPMDLQIQRLAHTMDPETMELFIDIMKTA